MDDFYDYVIINFNSYQNNRAALFNNPKKFVNPFSISIQGNSKDIILESGHISIRQKSMNGDYDFVPSSFRLIAFAGIANYFDNEMKNEREVATFVLDNQATFKNDNNDSQLRLYKLLDKCVLRRVSSNILFAIVGSLGSYAVNPLLVTNDVLMKEPNTWCKIEQGDYLLNFDFDATLGWTEVYLKFKIIKDW